MLVCVCAVFRRIIILLSRLYVFGLVVFDHLRAIVQCDKCVISRTYTYIITVKSFITHILTRNRVKSTSLVESFNRQSSKQRINEAKRKKEKKTNDEQNQTFGVRRTHAHIHII